MLKFSKAIPGFLQYKQAEGLSPNTVYGYERDIKLWLEHQGDVDVGWITSIHLLEYLNYLRSDYEPRRIMGDNDRPLAVKPVYNFYVSISAFFTWASREFEIPNRRKFVMQRSTGKRNKAILMMLLDAGLRANELCALRAEDVDLRTGRVHIRTGVEGRAKGRKGRTVYAGKSTRRFLWRYLADREEGQDPEMPFPIGKFGWLLNRNALRQVMATLGEKAEVAKAHSHRFRHIFAITYLRFGDDLFTLQRLLGHSSLEMVQHYANVVEIDIEQANPADNRRL